MADSPELPSGIPPSPEALWLYVNLSNMMRENYATKESVKNVADDVETIQNDRKAWVRSSVIVFLTGVASIAASFFEALVLRK